MVNPLTTFPDTIRRLADIAEDRGADYGDPRENFEQTSLVLHHAFGITLSASDIVKVLVAVKLAREKHKPKKDNMDDMAVYAFMLSYLQGTNPNI